MRREWREYWTRFARSSRVGLTWNLALVAGFFLVYMPILETNQYWLSMQICLAYGGSIFVALEVFYGVGGAILTWLAIRRGTSPEISKPLNFALGITAACLGSGAGAYFKGRLLGHHVGFDEILMPMLTGVFIALVFIFYGMYKHSQEINRELQSANVEAELHAFKNQMQPHFLLNSLNSLLALIETQSEKAPVMTQQLADLYRQILDNSNRHLVSLKSELAIIDRYLALEKFRFGDRLEYAITAPSQPEDIFVPPLILQTLVENAIKHGIGQEIEGGKISIGIQREESGYSAAIINPGRLSERPAANGTGLRNSHARLGLLYGAKHGLKIEQVGSEVHTRFWFSGETHA